jgi:hypothetical protein
MLRHGAAMLPLPRRRVRHISSTLRTEIGCIDANTFRTTAGRSVFDGLCRVEGAMSGNSHRPPQAGRIRFAIQPRDVPAEKAARRLYLTLPQFQALLPELQARGFPHPDPTTGMFDMKAVDLWMDRRSGLLGNAEAEPQARNAAEVFEARARKLLDG